MKKKLLAALMAGAMFAGLTACSGGTDTSTDGASDDAAANAGSGETYIIAMDTSFPPFEFEDSDGKRIGIDIEILDAIAEEVGVTFDQQALGFDAALAAVEAGQADAIMAGCSITEARKENMDFSEPYFDSGVAMGVAKDSEIDEYADLAGQNVAVKNGTEGASFAESIKDEYGFTVTIFDDSPTMYADVTVGNSAACFEDYPVLGYAITSGAELRMVGEMEQGSSYGFAVKKGENAELLAAFNEGLAAIRENGKYQEILDKFIQE